MKKLLSPGVRIIAEDLNGLFAVEKSVGILSHPNNSSNCTNSLFRNCAYDGNRECFVVPDSEEKFFLLNRLDSATSGVMLLANNEKVAVAVKDLFRRRNSVQKTYIAVCFGLKHHPARKTTIWEDEVTVSKSNEVTRTSQSGGGGSGKRVLARTTATVVNHVRSEALTVVQLSPLTGYSHQLRYQCSVRGLPIVGDKIYGNFVHNKQFFHRQDLLKANNSPSPDLKAVTTSPAITNRLFLHSHKIALQYSIDGIEQPSFHATSPIPTEMLRLMKLK